MNNNEARENETVSENDLEEAWIEETISLLLYEMIAEFFEGSRFKQS